MDSTSIERKVEADLRELLLSRFSLRDAEAHLSPSASRTLSKLGWDREVCFSGRYEEQQRRNKRVEKIRRSPLRQGPRSKRGHQHLQIRRAKTAAASRSVARKSARGKTQVKRKWSAADYDPNTLLLGETTRPRTGGAESLAASASSSGFFEQDVRAPFSASVVSLSSTGSTRNLGGNGDEGEGGKVHENNEVDPASLEFAWQERTRLRRLKSSGRAAGGSQSQIIGTLPLSAQRGSTADSTETEEGSAYFGPPSTLGLGTPASIESSLATERSLLFSAGRMRAQSAGASMLGTGDGTRPRPRSVGAVGLASDAIRGFPKTQLALLRERRRRGSDSGVRLSDEAEISTRPKSVGEGIVHDFRDRRALLSTPEARALLVETPKSGRRSPPSRAKSASLQSTATSTGARPRSSPHVGDMSLNTLSRMKSAHLSVFDVNTLRRDAEKLRIYKGIHGATPPGAHKIDNVYRSGSAKRNLRDPKGTQRRSRRRRRRIRKRTQSPHWTDEEDQLGEEYTTEEIHAAVVIEAWVRSRKVHWEVWRPMGIHEACACLLIQRVFRGMIGRKKATFMQMDLESRAVLTLQRNFRGAKARKFYFAALKLRRSNAATAIQSVFRGMRGRKRAKEILHSRRNFWSSIIQAAWRGFVARSKLNRIQTENKDINVLYDSFVSGRERDAFNGERRHSFDTLLQRASVALVVERSPTKARFFYLNSLSIRPNDPRALAGYCTTLQLCLDQTETALEIAANLERLVEAEPSLNTVSGLLQETTGTTSVREQLAEMEKTYYRPCLRRNSRSLFGLLCMAVMLQSIYGIEQEARVRRLYDRAFFIDQSETLLQQTHLTFSNYFTQPKKRVPFERVVKNEKSHGWARVCAYQRGTKLVFTVEDVHEGKCTSKDIIISQAEAQFALKTRRYVKFTSEKHLAALGNRLICVQKSSLSCEIVHPVLQRRRQQSARRITKLRALLLVQQLFRRKRAQRELERRKRLRRAKLEQQEHMASKLKARNIAFEQLNIGATKIQALARGRKQRKHLRALNKAATVFQTAVRGHLGRMRAREFNATIKSHRRKMKEYGAEVLQVFKRVRRVRGENLLVTVTRSGYNYLVTAINFEKCYECRGLIKGQQILDIIAHRPYGFDGAYSTKKRRKLHIWNHEEVLSTLLSMLSFTAPIKGLGDLGEEHAVLVVDPILGKALKGRSILSKPSEERRTLKDMSQVLKEVEPILARLPEIIKSREDAETRHKINKAKEKRRLEREKQLLARLAQRRKSVALEKQQG